MEKLTEWKGLTWNWLELHLRSLAQLLELKLKNTKAFSQSLSSIRKREECWAAILKGKKKKKEGILEPTNLLAGSLPIPKVNKLLLSHYKKYIWFFSYWCDVLTLVAEVQRIKQKLLLLRST